ncbi:MAG: DUF5318 family protein [Acidimicrobiales bacterium]
MAVGSRTGNAGVVSYRLARQQVVDSVVQGRRDREEVCDAQPELQRVATHHANPLSEPCPICDASDLGVVTFAFGPGLPSGGRCVTDLREMQRLRRRGRPTRGYRVEVCRSCWWNHLRETFLISDGFRSRRLLG